MSISAVQSAWPGTPIPVTPHPTEKDQYGLPVPNVHFDDHSSDIAMRDYAHKQGSAVYEAAGALKAIEVPPYRSIHNLGTRRMSENAADGVCNKFGQAHDIGNLFISDGSQFTTDGAENPKLTIVTLAIRQRTTSPTGWARTTSDGRRLARLAGTPGRSASGFLCRFRCFGCYARSRCAGTAGSTGGGRTSMLKEFKEFAMRGNVLDMAVGIIIGAAFGKIVSSLVNDLIMPPIGLLAGGVDFSEIYINLSGGSYESLAAAKEAGAATINFGVFINTVLDFVIVAFAIFLLIRNVNRLKRKEEAAPPPAPTTRDCPHCLSAIPIKATRCAHCTSQLEPA